MINAIQRKWIKDLAEMKPDENEDFNEGWKNSAYAILCYLDL